MKIESCAKSLDEDKSAMEYTIESTNDYDISAVGWVDGRLGVTGKDGAERLFGEADVFVVNTAKEVMSKSDFKLSIEPRHGHEMVRKCLDLLADVIHEVIVNSQKKVVVHCYAGIERSVLTCTWYLCKYEKEKVDDAYDRVLDARPCGIDRRTWAGGGKMFPRHEKRRPG